MRTFIVLLALFAIAFAQIGDYSHFIGGTTSQAGWHPANQFVAWDNTNNKFIDLPPASFGGGAVKQVAQVGAGIMAVGTFSSVNGQPAYGIAFFNGTNWCSLPHLSLYKYSTPLPSFSGLASQFPIQSSASPGTAMGVYVFQNQVYIFGGRNSGAPRFNAIGNILNANNVGFAGLCRLNIANGGTNFTLDTTFNSFRTQGSGAPYLDPGFAADSAPVVADASFVKFRVGGTQASPFIYVGVSANGGVTSTTPSVWNPSWGGWIANLASPTGGFNVTGITGLVAFTVTNPPTFGTVADFDVDVSQNPPVVILAGNYNFGVANAPYYHVATISVGSIGSATPTLAFNPVVNFNAQFPQNGFVGGFQMILQNPTASNDFWLAGKFNESITSTSINRIYKDVQYNRIFRVQSGALTALGDRFLDAPIQLSYVNSNVYAFFAGGTTQYNLINPDENYNQIRFTRRFSGAITWNGQDWQDAFGGFTDTASAWYGVSFLNNVYYIYGASTTGVYDLYTNGLVAFNNNGNRKRYVRASTQRLALRPTGALGVPNAGNGFNPFTAISAEGSIHTVHFLKSQPNGVSDAVVVAGKFDWYGTLFLGSVAYVRTDSLSADGSSKGTATWEQLGGGLWNSDVNSAFTLDKNSPLLDAGEVYAIEEANGKLYAGGIFSKNINGLCVNNVGAVNYKDGTLWYGLGAGCNSVVYDLYADGNKVYAGGAFTDCGGVPGTRAIAVWDEGENPPRWKALNTGIPSGTTYAIEKFRGQIYVGGSFTGSPASIRISGAKNGLFRWNGDRWQPVYARCQEFCGASEFEAPFQTTYDPVGREVSTVKSLKAYSGTLYARATLGAPAADYLMGYDGTRWSQFGAASSGSCVKQGCIATNATGGQIVGVSYSEISGAFNPNFQAWDKSKNNWVDTKGGVDSAEFVASAPVFSVSIIFAVVLAIFVFIF